MIGARVGYNTRAINNVFFGFAVTQPVCEMFSMETGHSLPNMNRKVTLYLFGGRPDGLLWRELETRLQQSCGFDFSSCEIRRLAFFDID